MKEIEEDGVVLFEYDSSGRVVDAEVDEDGWEQMVFPEWQMRFDSTLGYGVTRIKDRASYDSWKAARPVWDVYDADERVRLGLEPFKTVEEHEAEKKALYTKATAAGKEAWESYLASKGLSNDGTPEMARAWTDYARMMQG